MINSRQLGSTPALGGFALRSQIGVELLAAREALAPKFPLWWRFEAGLLLSDHK